MKIEHKGEEITLKYTFNSFRYMEELDLGELEDLESMPFKILGITETLLRGALNYNPNKKYNNDQVVEIIEDVMENGDLMELLEILMNGLQESSFFKNLQGKSKKAKVKTVAKKK